MQHFLKFHKYYYLRVIITMALAIASSRNDIFCRLLNYSGQTMNALIKGPSTELSRRGWGWGLGGAFDWL